MLTREKLKTALRLLDKVTALRDTQDRLHFAESFTISGFMMDVAISVPEDEVHLIKEDALRYITKQISDIEQELTDLGVTAD